MDTIQVHFHLPGRQDVLTLALPRETTFSALTGRLYAENFIKPQKPGYRFLYQEHLCGMKHILGDYIPGTAVEMDLEIFQFPAVLV
ncbi:MAG: hypothetical protein HFF84_04830 [Oscillibacter sp.]|nr:hypothetical protein [Oscillibacter sp.]